MIQTGLIPNAHNDLVTDASYDFYGLRLATCSLDQRIKIWELDETNNWNVEDDWKAHDAAISKLSWAHPEFGSIIASASFDRTVKIWEQVSTPESEHQSGGIRGSQAYLSGSSRWVERAILSDAKGTVRSVEFCPHYFGLKLATIATDNTLRIYDCVEQPSLTSWQLTEEFDVQSTPPPTQQPGYLNNQTLGIATPTQTYATAAAAAGAVGEIGASASLVTQALQQQQQQQSVAAATAAQRQQLGNREADGGWCLSWCKDKYWGEVLAVGCGTTGIIKIVQINARRSTTLLSLPSSSNTAITTTSRPPPSPQLPTSTTVASASTLTIVPLGEIAQTEQRPPATPSPPPTNAITSAAWAPSCGRSYHLIATGGRDGHVRIWKVKPGNDGFYGGAGGTVENADGEDDNNSAGEEEEDQKWTASVVADFDQHRASVGRVEWNITGTVLSSAGNDGRVRLWKATVGNVWRSAGSLGVEQTDDASPSSEKKDVEMES